MIPASRINTTVLGLLSFCMANTCFAGNLIDRMAHGQKAMVTVTTELTRLLHTTPPSKATFYRNAAGIVIDPSGIIATNTHTIIHAPFVFVILRDGTKLPAQLIYTSAKYDFSFLRIYPARRLTAITWADPTHAAVGQDVMAIAHSDLHNQTLISGHIQGFVQTPGARHIEYLELDLNLYHGDSGGPILDAQGRLLGIIMARRKSKSNASLAIASNIIHRQYLQYKKNMP